MEKITSRKNPAAGHLRRLGRDRDYRAQRGEYLCEGIKTLDEAVKWGREVGCVLWAGEPMEVSGLRCPQYTAPADLIEYVSPMKNSPGPVFSVSMRKPELPDEISRGVILDTVQDPGNLGTILRSANAFGVDAVVLTGACADPYNPKAVRASMGAHFRQCFLSLGYDEVPGFLERYSLAPYCAMLSEDTMDVRELPKSGVAVVIGSEGSGVGAEMAALGGSVGIPMNPACESLNAAIAASVIMWELFR